VTKHVVKTTTAYKVEIFIGGALDTALNLCESFCTGVGLCVTVEPTTYTYRGGRCDGVRVGLINYARFPKPATEIWEMAEYLADFLLTGLGQAAIPFRTTG
jgi:hypothetical protein